MTEHVATEISYAIEIGHECIKASWCSKFGGCGYSLCPFYGHFQLSGGGWGSCAWRMITAGCQRRRMPSRNLMRRICNMYIGLQIDNVSRETLIQLSGLVSDIAMRDCTISNYRCDRCRHRHECLALCDFAQALNDEAERKGGAADVL